MFAILLLVLFYLFSPLGILFLTGKVPVLRKVGAVILAYLLGLLVGNSGLLPEDSGKVQETINTIAVPLALPLLLFSTDLRRWFSLAGVSLKAMLTGIFSVLVMVISGYYFFRSIDFPELRKVAGMLVGVYTGGTPNLASLKIMLEVDEHTYLLTHTYDMLISGAYILFLMSAGKRLFRWFLRPFQYGTNEHALPLSSGEDLSWEGIPGRKDLLKLWPALVLAVIILLGSYGFSLLFPENSQVVVIILTITTLGLLSSLDRRIHSMEKTFESGMYLILIFSVSVASMVRVRDMLNFSAVLLPYLTYVIFGSLFLHALLSRVFRVDSDTMMAASTALICSPPFVPVIAASLNNRQVIVSGLTIGIVGYAIGNYLGYLVSQLLWYL